MSLIKVIDVEGFVLDSDTGITSLVCYLENGEEFVLYNVPYEVIKALIKLKELKSKFIDNDLLGSRDSIFDILLMFMPYIKEPMSSKVDMIVIDELDKEALVYVARAYIRDNGLLIKKSMIPSHAIFLALMLGKPIYVTTEMLRINKELLNLDTD